MKPSQENPPRVPGETAAYEEDPFELGEIDESSFVVVEDFLPRPEDLVLRPKGVKVTLVLDEDSVNFFKAEAARLHVPYQRMIRNLVQEYVARIRRMEHNHRSS